MISGSGLADIVSIVDKGEVISSVIIKCKVYDTITVILRKLINIL